MGVGDKMVDVRRAVEVAVIDEIQMMSDRSRGWAWTRALYGVPAREVHVCGDPTAKPLLEQAARLLGDRLEIKTYQRITPLGIAPRPLSSYKEVQPGDCVVAFSRKDIFEIKSEIEQHTRHKCCVVYGALPPETRRQQAKLFNDTASGYDVLVASDAIGMGLNLNIRRVIFHRLSKYGERGQGMIPVPPAQVKQIAGRAGRHGTEWDHGWVTCRYKEDLPALFEGMSSPPTPATAAGLFPILDQVAAFASQLPKESLHAVFSKFMENAQHDGHFFICNHQESLRLAELLEQVPGLSLSERFCFMVAPVNTKDSMMCDALADFASQYAIGEGVRLRISEPGEVPQDTSALQRLEFQYQVVSLYQWLANRLQDVKDLESQRVLFHDRELAENMASTVSRILGDGLRNIQPVFGRKQPLIPNKLRSDTEGHALSHGSLAKIQLRRIT